MRLNRSLKPGNVHSAEGWREALEPIFKRYGKTRVRLYFRADAAFAKPEVYIYLEEHSLLYAIRLPANDILEREIKHLLKRPEGELPEKPVIRYHDFQYQAGSWDHPRQLDLWHRAMNEAIGQD